MVLNRSPELQFTKASRKGNFILHASIRKNGFKIYRYSHSVVLIWQPVILSILRKTLVVFAGASWFLSYNPIFLKSRVKRYAITMSL